LRGNPNHRIFDRSDSPRYNFRAVSFKGLLNLSQRLPGRLQVDQSKADLAAIQEEKKGAPASGTLPNALHELRPNKLNRLEENLQSQL
jgi:hypothetical protein